MTELRVWAPIPKRVRAWIAGEVQPMQRDSDGWWSVTTSATPGTDYGFMLDDDETVLPDPASRWQPNGVHEPSRLYDQAAYVWGDQHWTGRALPGAVIYELHIGTFTQEGTFDSAVERLPHLVELGITHVEVLPINAVNGAWNWGYDGVGWYATTESYGGPDGFKRFVDACHQHGLGVVLDVVYNHLGPSGNYLPRFGPFFNPGTNTWGDLINLDGQHAGPVRAFILENALMWLNEFHADALRLDAVHALADTSVPHLLEELAAEVDALSARVGRPLTLIAESDLNDPNMIMPRTAGGRGMDAQWDDDVHHALHSLITGEQQGYYNDFGGLSTVAKVLTSGFFHDGSYSTFRGHMHGRPVDRALTPGYRFVVCLQNHDQVGNRAVGDRISELTTPARQQIAMMLLLASPFTPMLWMGEEWAASTRWPYFTSHPEKELSEVASKKRIEEFASHGWDVEQMIDPQDPRAFTEAKLKWDEVAEPPHASMLDFYRSMIALRHAEPDLADPRLDHVEVEFDEDAKWMIVHRGKLRVLVNLGDADQTLPVQTEDIVLSTGAVRIDGGGVLLEAETAAIVRVS
jgi:maltooligosyltrehalose trehalohydrolase